MPQLAILLMAVVIGILLFVFLKKSKAVDTLTYDLTHDAPAKADTSELISKAQTADKALVSRAGENIQAIEALQSESQVIDDYRKPAEPVSVDEVKAESEESEESEEGDDEITE